MNDMKVGDELDFKGPTGHIIYEGQGVFNIRGEKKTYKKIGCLAGGTGVTPCFQLMQHTDKNSEPLEISLLYANQTPDDILMKDQLDEFPSKGMKVNYTVDRVPDGTSRRAAACGRAELRALTFGGAVWGVFRENANCGDPVGNLWVTYGSAYISPGLNWENPAKFRLHFLLF